MIDFKQLVKEAEEYVKGTILTSDDIDWILKSISEGRSDLPHKEFDFNKTQFNGVDMINAYIAGYKKANE